MDHFHEEIVVRKNKQLANVLYALLSVLVAIGAVYTIFVLSSLTQTIFAQPWNMVLLQALDLVLAGGITLLLFFLRSRLRIEYEYAFTNGFLEIAQVINNSKRKELLGIKYKEVEAVGPCSSEVFARYEAIKDKKVIKAVLNKEKERYFVYSVRGDEKYLSILEPTQELVQLMREYYDKAFQE